MRKAAVLVVSVGALLLALAGCGVREYRYAHVLGLKERLALSEPDSGEAAWLAETIAELEGKERQRLARIETERERREAERVAVLEAEKEHQEAERLAEEKAQEEHRRWFASLTRDQQLEWLSHRQRVESLEEQVRLIKEELERERAHDLTIANQIKNWAEARRKNIERMQAIRGLAQGLHQTGQGLAGLGGGYASSRPFDSRALDEEILRAEAEMIANPGY